ncbi:restriction endonuclease subunit S [Sorangium cellulosum]|uniref:restriction endonuclease subunit S n=1 Tax=Sorangium cellulosum TaxID=56 RepID=UPI003D9A6F76
MSKIWPQIRVEQIQADTPSAIAIGPFGSRMKADVYTLEGVRVIRGSNISDTRRLQGDFVFVSEETANNLRASGLQPNDLVFPHRGAIGEVGLVPDDGHRYMMSTSLMKLTCNQRVADPKFIFYFFRSATGRNELLKNASTVGTPGIATPLTSLKSLWVPVPPLAVQLSIARILGALDDKIDLNRRTSETLEAMIRALFQASFVDFVGSTEFVHTEHGRMPRRWSASTLRDHVTLQRGTTYSGNFVGLPGPALLGLGSIEPGGGFRDGHYKTYGGECPEKLTLYPGDLFVALKGATKDGTMVGSIARVPSSVASGRLTQDTVKLQFLKPGNRINRYIYWLLRMPQYRAYCAGRITGSAQVGLSRDDFLNYPVPLPPDDTLAAFAENESSLSQHQDLLTAECKSLAALRDTLLPKLLSGELRALEAERAVEAAL